MNVKTLCLGVLFAGDASGYEIKKQLEEGPFGRFQAPGYGSIYPALAGLARDGLVTMREIAQDKRPDKKVYGLTIRGRLALLDAVTRSPEPDRIRSDFAFATFFGELLPAGRLDRIIDERIAALKHHLGEMKEMVAMALRPGQRFTVGYAIAIYEAQIAYLEANRHVLVAAALESETSVADEPPAERREPVN
jgi:DNA-binding PadR family transcriptional regulator